MRLRSVWCALMRNNARRLRQLEIHRGAKHGAHLRYVVISEVDLRYAGVENCVDQNVAEVVIQTVHLKGQHWREKWRGCEEFKQLHKMFHKKIEEHLHVKDLELGQAVQHFPAKLCRQLHAKPNTVEVKPLQVLVNGESREEIVSKSGLEDGLGDLPRG
jgi:hypothetical protein